MVLGQKGGNVYDGTLNANTIMVLICTAISVGGGLELIFLIFYGFKRYGGLYFWSLTAATLSVIPYSLAFIFMYFRPQQKVATGVVNNVSWICMVLGQSLVLYSRLHLVFDRPHLLRAILWFILGTTAIFYVATSAVQFGSYGAADFTPYYEASKVIEKIQMTGFSFQESLLAGLYIREVLRIQRTTTQGTTRRTMWQLFTVNAFVIALDLALLVMEYMNLLVFQQTFKGAAYAIKLKMEFAVLGKLIDMVQPNQRWPYHLRDVDLNVFPSNNAQHRDTLNSFHVEPVLKSNP